jgi:hypothetical protein
MWVDDGSEEVLDAFMAAVLLGEPAVGFIGDSPFGDGVYTDDDYEELDEEEDYLELYGVMNGMPYGVRFWENEGASSDWEGGSEDDEDEGDVDDDEDEGDEDEEGEEGEGEDGGMAEEVEGGSGGEGGNGVWYPLRPSSSSSSDSD